MSNGVAQSQRITQAFVHRFRCHVSSLLTVVAKDYRLASTFNVIVIRYIPRPIKLAIDRRHRFNSLAALNSRQARGHQGTGVDSTQVSPADRDLWCIELFWLFFVLVLSTNGRYSYPISMPIDCTIPRWSMHGFDSSL